MSEIFDEPTADVSSPNSSTIDYQRPDVVFRCPIQNTDTKAGVTSIYINNLFDIYIKCSKYGKIISKVIHEETSLGEIEINWNQTDKDLESAIKKKTNSVAIVEVVLKVIHSKKDEIKCFVFGIAKHMGLNLIKDYIDNPTVSDLSRPEILVKSSERVNGDEERKREFFTYKYTSKTKLYEAVLLVDLPYFVTIDEDGRPQIIDEIIEETRVLKPPHKEDYIYQPYSFENMDELDSFISTVKTLSIDSVFWKINQYVSKFIIHHKHIRDYISALIFFTYFQDKFPTVPYTMFVSDNGSGKSSIGDMFEITGYRCINMTDPTTANVYRILGNIETGQCSLVLDEVDKIDQSDMMSVLKSGYEKNKIITRTNNQSGKQEHFHAFCVKVMLGERTPDPSKAKGVLDRTFIISNFKGKPELDIKEIKNAENGHQLKVKQQLDFLRKTLMIYRLIHINDEIKDIETGLEGRDKELSKPILQLFYGTKCLENNENALEKLLDEKHDRKANSLERDALEVIVELFDDYADGVIPFHSIWRSIEVKTNGHINEYKTHQLETEVHGTIYKTSFSKMLRDKFGAKDPTTRESNTRSLSFDIDKTKKYLESYTKENGPTKIECSLILDSDSSDSSDSDLESQLDRFWNTELPVEDERVRYEKEANKIMADMGLI